MRSYPVQWYHQVPHPVKEIIARLKSSGKVAWIAGGAVRDLLLGISPKDFDIVTDARPEEIEALFPKTLAIGKQFGIIAVISGAATVEVASFRSDGAYIDGRHPNDISFISDPSLDAMRRDFTINALFYDPNQELILDYVDGKDDLDHRLIRCVGDSHKRFAEDGLRVLRALRFLAQLNSFQLAPETERAVIESVERLKPISKERITQEMHKILAANNPAPALKKMGQSNLWPIIFGDGYPGDIFIEQFIKARALDANFLPQSDALALFLAPINFNETAAKIFLSNSEKKMLKEIRNSFNEIKSVPHGSLADKKITMNGQGFNAAWAWLTAKGESSEWFISLPREKIDFQNLGRLNPAPLIKGEDLKNLGMIEGPEIKDVLLKIRRAQLEEKIHDKNAAISLAQEIIRIS